MADPAGESGAIDAPDAPETNLKWKDTEDTGETPGPRFGHTLSVVGSTAYLFGGARRGASTPSVSSHSA